MYIYYDENNYVYGYGSEYEERSILVDFVPEEVSRWLGCYKYEDGEYILNENRKAWLEQHEAYESELNSLEQWFEWYDQQNIQYQRSVRLNIEFDRDIEELDAQAVLNSQRIAELRKALAEQYNGD